jgi:hypothetical protein
MKKLKLMDVMTWVGLSAAALSAHGAAAIGAEKRTSTREIEAAVAHFDGMNECESVRSLLIQSGVSLGPIASPGGSSCYQSGAGPAFEFNVKDTGAVEQVLRGSNLMDTESCKTLARTLFSTAFNDGPQRIEHLTAYCDSSEQFGMSRLVAHFDHKNRIESVINTQTMESCEKTRAAIINAGLGVQLDPVRCYESGKGPAMTLMIVQPDSPHRFTARSVIPQVECINTIEALSTSLVIYPGDKSSVMSGQCVVDAWGNAKMAVTIDPYGDLHDKRVSPDNTPKQSAASDGSPDSSYDSVSGVVSVAQ